MLGINLIHKTEEASEVEKILSQHQNNKKVVFHLSADYPIVASASINQKILKHPYAIIAFDEQIYRGLKRQHGELTVLKLARETAYQQKIICLPESTLKHIEHEGMQVSRKARESLSIEEQRDLQAALIMSSSLDFSAQGYSILHASQEQAARQYQLSKKNPIQTVNFIYDAPSQQQTMQALLRRTRQTNNPVVIFRLNQSTELTASLILDSRLVDRKIAVLEFDDILNNELRKAHIGSYAEQYLDRIARKTNYQQKIMCIERDTLAKLAETHQIVPKALSELSTEEKRELQAALIIHAAQNYVLADYQVIQPQSLESVSGYELNTEYLTPFFIHDVNMDDMIAEEKLDKETVLETEVASIFAIKAATLKAASSLQGAESALIPSIMHMAGFNPLKREKIQYLIDLADKWSPNFFASAETVPSMKKEESQMSPIVSTNKF